MARNFNTVDYDPADSTATDRDPIVIEPVDADLDDAESADAEPIDAVLVNPETTSTDPTGIDSTGTESTGFGSAGSEPIRVVSADDSPSSVGLAPEPPAADRISDPVSTGLNGSTDLNGSTGLNGSTDLDASNDARWHDIVAGFIDDPRGSVAEAADLVEADVTALIALLSKRRDTMGDGWQSGQSADSGNATEDLRLALRGYRDFSRQIAASTKALG